MAYEYCSVCGEKTGRAGRLDDSIYREVRKTSDELFRDGERVCHIGDDVAGPLCEDCCDEMLKLGFFAEE